MQPWWSRRPCRAYWELPENFCPSMVRVVSSVKRSRYPKPFQRTQDRDDKDVEVEVGVVRLIHNKGKVQISLVVVDRPAPRTGGGPPECRGPPHSFG